MACDVYRNISGNCILLKYENSGKRDHSEKLTYDIDDARPDGARVQGDSEYIQALKDHVLTWRGRLDVSSDARNFFYKYTRTLLRDGVIIRTKTWEEPIPRDHQ